jgi:hypothetical protein
MNQPREQLQNNGFIWHEVGQLSLRNPLSLKNCLSMNVSYPDGRYLFVHSATYEQLLTRFGLAPQQLVEAARPAVGLIRWSCPQSRNLPARKLYEMYNFRTFDFCRRVARTK